MLAGPRSRDHGPRCLRLCSRVDCVLVFFLCLLVYNFRTGSCCLSVDARCLRLLVSASYNNLDDAIRVPLVFSVRNIFYRSSPACAAAPALGRAQWELRRTEPGAILQEGLNSKKEIQ